MTRVEELLTEGIQNLTDLGKNHSLAIRMLDARMKDIEHRLSALEQPATVAAEPDGLHPVARLLAEAYRGCYDDNSIDINTKTNIRLAWCSITGTSTYEHQDAILAYGIPK